MKEIPLTKGFVAIIDDDDLVKLPPGRWCVKDGYAHKRVKGRPISLHRLVMGVLDDNSVQIDHINGIRTDCRKDNLRKCTAQQNAQNRSGSGKTRFKGVLWAKNMSRWLVKISVGGKPTHVGFFEDEDEAARHYNLAATKEYGEFARLNNVHPLFPENGDLIPKVTLRNNTLGFRGVIKSGRGWAAQAEKEEKNNYIGGFSSPEDAARAYDDLAKRLFGDKAKLNFPQPLP